MSASSIADPTRVSAKASVSPVAVVAEPQSSACDACKPRLTPPTVRYLRHNGQMHEVEVSFTFGLPGCFGSAPKPDFRVVAVQRQQHSILTWELPPIPITCARN